LGQEVGAFVDQCIQSLKEKDCIDSAVKASLRGRLAYLKSESIRGALKRLVQERLPNSSAAWNVVDEAYALRSEIVHTGKPSDLDTDIQEKSKDLEDVVMDLYRKLYVYKQLTSAPPPTPYWLPALRRQQPVRRGVRMTLCAIWDTYAVR